jgi:hypothetical protein
MQKHLEKAYEAVKSDSDNAIEACDAKNLATSFQINLWKR